MGLEAYDIWQPATRCVHFVCTGGVAGAIDYARQHGYVVRTLDGRAMQSEDALFSAIGSCLQFPSYFGSNWDALQECLRDVADWLPAAGFLVVVESATHFWQQSVSMAGLLVMSWLTASESMSADGVPFHLVFVLAER